jgi:hypothetical protein
MLFNELLAKENIDPAKVLVLRHTPKEPELRDGLPMLASEKPDLFNAYQQTQTVAVEKKLLNAEYVASFIGLETRKSSAAQFASVFVGLYKVGNHQPLTYQEFWNLPAYKELRKFKLRGFVEGERPFVNWFDLTITEFYKRWQGKLIIEWPRPAIQYARFAHQNDFPIHAILEDSALHEAMPEWDKCILPWSKFNIIPLSWRKKLSEWRGIYYIHDQLNYKGYIGSAYGEENIYGRWRVHVENGGDSVLLRQRSPENFVFSILQLVSPTSEKNDVVTLESNWKNRLHTQSPSGLNDN